MNKKRSQFSAMNDIMNGIVNEKKGHNIVNNSFGQKQFFGMTSLPDNVNNIDHF